MNIPPELAQWRKTQRAELLRRRLAAAPDDRQRWIETITTLLEQGFPILQRMVIGFCWPYMGEFDARFVIRFLRDRGARAALPAVIEKNAPLQFREWWPGVTTTPGVFDLPVPDNTGVLVPDAVLIPPVGFGEQGDRLGYGGGFFDRTLAVVTPQPLKIAVGFELSRIPTTYPQPHDILMDFIVTELGIYAVADDGLRPISLIESAALSNQIASDRGLPRMQESM
jgi:5,10-methenyltetrahydrofolate synthetase